MTDFDAGHFRSWLRNEMRGRRISQRMLAERSGVDHSSISRILSSSRTPSMATMARLAAALGASLPAFVTPGLLGGSLDSRIRAALIELGVEPEDVDDMLALHRRRRMQGRWAG